MTTDYRDTFITVSADCPVDHGEVPAKAESVAGMQHALLHGHPHEMTSDDLLFEVYARRHGVAAEDREAARTAFFARSQACLRASPLVKRHGWGIHHDAEGRIALHGVESAEYRALAERTDLRRVPGMRRTRTK